jgi:pimeloyl-ACP methyl ester carboxylesterase
MRVGGVELAVDTFGDPGDPTILLIAGRSSPMDWWDAELCQRLAAGGHHVVRYDHRDTGASTACAPGRPDYTFADLVEDAAGILDGLGVGRAHVVGLSMGGAIAQVLAVTHPDRVASLTLIGTSVGVGDWPDDLPPMGEDLAEPEPADDPVERVAGIQRAFMRGPIDEARLRATAASVVARTRDLAAVENHELMASGPSPEGSLADIAVPTLVVHGAADPLFPVGHGEHLARSIPGATLLVLDDVGHEVPPARTWDVLVPALLRHTSSD